MEDTNATPSRTVLLVTADIDHRKAWQAAFVDRGIAVSAFPDVASAQATFNAGVVIDAIVIEPTQPHDLYIVEQLREAVRSQPLAVMVLKDSQRDMLAAAVSMGIDLPLLAEQEPEDLVEAIVCTLERRKVPPSNIRWSINPISWVLQPPRGTPIQLSYKECRFLLVLAKAPGRPIERTAFSEIFSANEDTFDHRRLDIMVRRLRTKVREQCDLELPMHTAHGIGYALPAPMRVTDEIPVAYKG